MSNRTNITTLIKSISGQANILAIPRIYISITGDINSALLLSQCVYWSDKSKRQDGFFFKKYEEWEEETSLSPYQVNSAAKRLEAIGVLERQVKRAGGAPTVHYRVDFDVLGEKIIEFLDNQVSRKSKNQKWKLKKLIILKLKKLRNH